MRIERHYDDEVLIAFLNSLDRSTLERDPHLVDCATCSATLSSYRAINDTLGEGAVWDLRELSDQPVPRTIARLRAAALDMSREDADADAWIKQLLDGPREWWLNRLRLNPHWRTAGMVRKLLAATDRAIETMPPDALEMTALAIDIAEALKPSSYASELVQKLRAAAWRERAYALMVRGELLPAETAIFCARERLASVTVDEFDRARLTLVHALIDRELERYHLASGRASESAEVFERFGDASRSLFASMTEAAIHYARGDARAALDVSLAIESEARRSLDDVHKAKFVHNLGVCYRSIGQFDLARKYFAETVDTFERLDMRASRTRARWHVARILVAQQRYGDALPLLEQTVAEFEELEMAQERMLAQLDIAEVLVVLDRKSEVQILCRSLLERMSEPHAAASQNARVALAFLKEATDSGRVTPGVVAHVKNYIELLPTRPQLLFAPLPE